MAVAKQFRADSRIFSAADAGTPAQEDALQSMISTVFDRTSDEMRGLITQSRGRKGIEEKGILSYLEIHTDASHARRIPGAAHEVDQVPQRAVKKSRGRKSTASPSRSILSSRIPERQQRLRSNHIRAVLTGGACASFYSGGVIHSKDIDFVLSGSVSRAVDMRESGRHLLQQDDVSRTVILPGDQLNIVNAAGYSTTSVIAAIPSNLVPSRWPGSFDH